MFRMIEAKEKRVLTTWATTSKGSGEPAHMRCLAKPFAVETLRKFQAKNNNNNNKKNQTNPKNNNKQIMSVAQIGDCVFEELFSCACSIV